MKASDSVSSTTKIAIKVRVPRADEREGFDARLATHHHLGAGRPVGDHLRQVVGSAGILDPWLRPEAGELPQAPAMDGKMVRDPIGLLALAQHEDGAPQAVAVHDPKEGTPRCPARSRR